MLLGDLHEPVNAAIHDGLAGEAARRDVRLLLTTGRGRRALERTALEDLLDLRLDGVVLTGPRITATEIGRAAAGSAVTVVGRALRSAGADCVTGDDSAAVDQAIGHLTSLGHRRIACLDLGSRPSPLRRACEAALGGTAVLTDPDEPWRAPDPPTAVLALGDTTGTAALTALLRAGRNVPGDVSLIVHGDPPGARSAGVTTTAPPPQELGRLAMAALLDRIHDAPAKARRLTVPPRLTERGTTGPVRR
ncbi:LacI family DNA-binding transcriptional regulator [Actinomadura sp. 3N407]|uniref:LacI family DNA-binding transcriptional regulator n=1 Tax=Actinomadura sp. 3N407 TaxID=3457423 RepID=UPI003FCD1030